MPFSNGFLLSLSLCLDIGVANIAMITLAMQRGFLQGFWLGLGTCVGDLIYAIAALAGMTVLLQFESVRWTLWVGGSALLAWFAVKMLLAAWRGGHLESRGQVVVESGWREFLRGIFLAMSSPSAILWFAAVGGVLISRSGAGSGLDAGLFLGGFFAAGLLWCVSLCGYRQSWRATAWRSPADLVVPVVGGDLLLFRRLRGAFRLPRIHPGSTGLIILEVLCC